MKKILLSAVAFAAIASPALAADLPVRAPAPAPYLAPSPAVNWTGFYAGVDLGGSWGNANMTIPVGFTTLSRNMANEGIIGGGFVGYNFQYNNFVIGLQGGFDGAGNGGSHTRLSYLGNVYENGFSQTWIASIDGRLGYAIDKALIYAIGGVAFDEQGANLSVNNIQFFNRSSNQTGYDVGFGGEYMITANWTARVEYRYYNFGASNYTSPFGPVGNVNYRTTVTDNVVRAGVAYKF